MEGFCKAVEQFFGIGHESTIDEVRANRFRPSFDMGDDKFLGIETALQQPPKEDKPQSVVIKKQGFDVSKIIPYTPKQGEKTIVFDPPTLDEYIGQEDAKAQIRTVVDVINKVKPVNVLINGWPGCGKTALANILASMLNADFILITPELINSVDKLTEVLNRIHSSDKLTVLCIDEIQEFTKHKEVIEILLPILQGWKYAGAHFKPFVLVGATTDKDRLVRDQPAFVSRFQYQITLSKYKPNELALIVKNYKKAIFDHLPINEGDYEIIAANGRGIPRQAIGLLLKQLAANDMGRILKQEGIIKNGIMKMDLTILKALEKNKTPMGASYLSQVCGIQRSDYEVVYEPYLVEEGYILRRSNGRIISDKGKRFLKQITKGCEMAERTAMNDENKKS